MTEPTNINCFEIAAGAILAELFQAFPHPVGFFADAFQRELVTGGRLPESCVVPKYELGGQNLITATMLWLADERLIRHQGKTAYHFKEVTLTAGGLRGLSSPVLPLSDGETYGSRLVGFVTNAVTTGISATLSGVIAAAIR